MKSLLLLCAIYACASAIVVPPPPATCNVQGANSRPDRLKVEAFCNDPKGKTTGNALLKGFADKWTWSYVPLMGTCHRHRIAFNGTDQVYTDVKGDLEWVYIEVDGVVYRDQPAVWHCASVSTNFYALDSSPDHNVILQIECVTGGYEFYFYIQDYTKVTKENRAELTTKYGFDLTNMDPACAALTAPSS